MEFEGIINNHHFIIIKAFSNKVGVLWSHNDWFSLDALRKVSSTASGIGFLISVNLFIKKQFNLFYFLEDYKLCLERMIYFLSKK